MIHLFLVILIVVDIVVYLGGAAYYRSYAIGGGAVLAILHILALLALLGALHG